MAKGGLVPNDEACVVLPFVTEDELARLQGLIDQEVARCAAHALPSDIALAQKLHNGWAYR